METFVNPQGSFETLRVRFVDIVKTVWLTLVAAVMFTSSPATAGMIGLELAVHDANGYRIPNFEAMLHTHHEGYIRWQAGKNGLIHFGDAGVDSLTLLHDWQFQAIVRAPDLAPAILHLEGTGYMERTVILTPGRLIELTITTSDGRPIPRDVTPLVVYTEFADRVRPSLMPENIRPGHTFDFEVSKVRYIGEDRYQFRIPNEASPFFLLIDQPGFMRSTESEVFDEDDLSDGRIEWQMPAPATLNIQFEMPYENEKPGYDFSLVALAPYAPDAAKYYTTWLERFDNLSFEVLLDDLPPNRYRLTMRLIPPTHQTDEGTNKIRFCWDTAEFDLAAGERKTINLEYVPYDPNTWRGSATATVIVKHYGGEPAAGSSYTLSYMVPHYGSAVVKQGELDAAGRFQLEGVRSGPDGPEFFLKVGDESLGRMRVTEKGSQSFEFTLAPRAEDRVPDIMLTDVQTGEEVSLRSFRGKVVYMEFWATWCGPCKTPMAKLNTVLQRRRNEWDGRAEVIAVSIDETKEVVYRYTKTRGWDHVRHFWTGQTGKTVFESPAAKGFGISGVPTAMLIDPEGVIVWRGHPEGGNCEGQIDAILRQVKTIP